MVPELADCCLGNSTESSLSGISLLCARGCKFVLDALICCISKLVRWKSLAARLQQHPPVPSDNVLQFGFPQPAARFWPQSVETVSSHFNPGCSDILRADRKVVMLWSENGGCRSLAVMKTELNGAAVCGVFWYRTAGDASVNVSLSVCLSVCLSVSV